MKIPAICIAPQYVCEELLRAEGFTDIGYVDAASSAEFNEAIASGKADFTEHYASPLVAGIGCGAAITVLAGVHVGCLELFGSEGIRNVADLKGKTVGVTALGSSEHLFVSVMAAHIGLDPGKDIRWVTSRSPTPAELFADGKIDAVLGTPPIAPGILVTLLPTAPSTVPGRNISAACCRATGSLCAKHPVATKRVLRATLKAADLCATEPARVARMLVDGGFSPAGMTMRSSR
jgi:NitT/TauT family transport system substrate-binding protein